MSRRSGQDDLGGFRPVAGHRRVRRASVPRTSARPGGSRRPRQTTATQAMQIWVDRDRPRSSAGSRTPSSAATRRRTTPSRTCQSCASMSGSRRRQCSTCARCCPDAPEGDRPAPGEDPAAWVRNRRASVEARRRRLHTRRAVGLWPGAPTPPPGGSTRASGWLRYVRGNVQPSDRYVLSVPGSVRYRLDPGDTGYDNLVIAGDWTRCVINAGCVEAATISGMLAAEAILHRLGSELPVPVMAGQVPRRERSPVMSQPADDQQGRGFSRTPSSSPWTSRRRVPATCRRSSPDH